MKFVSLVIILQFVTWNILSQTVRPHEWVQLLPKPQFKPGHTLPLLTRTGYPLSVSTNLLYELATDWGYAVEWDLSNSTVSVFTNSLFGQFSRDLVLSNTNQYKLSVMINRAFPTPIPDEFWCSTNGFWVDNSGNLWHTGDTPSYTKVQSPAVSNSYLEESAKFQLSSMTNLAAIVPITMLRNTGETGLGTYDASKGAWTRDPVVTAAQSVSGVDFERYGSIEKARELGFVYRYVQSYFPNRMLYFYYNVNSEATRVTSHAWDSGYDGDLLNDISDLPSFETYFFPGGNDLTPEKSLATYDLLTLLLNGVGFQLADGKSNFFNWTQGGFYSNRTNRAPAQVWKGFLKCHYMTGALGADAGYYVDGNSVSLAEIHTEDDDYTGGYDGLFPSDKPPGFIEQIVALAYVHAQFSWLEEFLRNGHLLSGPQFHRLSTDQPAYEFTNSQSYSNCRTLARKHNDRDEWLICAWAADGTNRNITVTIPTLGDVNLLSAADGNLYRATVASGPRLVNQYGEIGNRVRATTTRAGVLRGP